MTEKIEIKDFPKNISILKTVKHSFKFFFNNFYEALYIATPLLLLLLVTMGLYGLVLIELSKSQSQPAFFPLIYTIGMILYSFIFIYISSFAFYNWYSMNLFGFNKGYLANPILPKIYEIHFFIRSCLFYLSMAIIFLLGFVPIMFLLPYFPSAILELGFNPVYIPIFFGGLFCIFMQRAIFYFPAKVEGYYVGFIESIRQFTDLTWKFTVTILLIWGIFYTTDNVLEYIMVDILNEYFPKFPFIYQAISSLILNIAMPFVMITSITIFYKWRKHNPLEGELPITAKEDMYD